MSFGRPFRCRRHMKSAAHMQKSSGSPRAQPKPAIWPPVYSFASSAAMLLNADPTNDSTCDGRKTNEPPAIVNWLEMFLHCELLIPQT